MGAEVWAACESRMIDLATEIGWHIDSHGIEARWSTSLVGELSALHHVAAEAFDEADEVDLVVLVSWVEDSFDDASAHMSFSWHR